MTKKPPKPAGITNAILLQHMQGMRYSLEVRVDSLDKRMDSMEKRMGGTEKHMGGMEGRLGTMEKNIVDIKDALQRPYIHRTSMLGRIEKLEETVGIA
ncbi:MAG: hypothetical protein PHX87_02050 [Candidatus Peribacteraceae bacterium]|nr:hypothetical protein [Candidatus Peribacteraceae bacterium]MDD5742190.1 hypothetical protein [Candidatus Peribacteraceae bacterium]